MTLVSILHLSDIHYKSPGSNYFGDNKADIAAAMGVNIFANLHHLLDYAFNKDQFAAIAVSGDFTTQGSVEGFDFFRHKTYPFLRALVAEDGAICLVPGNHDVTWNIPGDTADYFDRKFKAFRLCVEKTRATSCLIPTGRIPTDDQGSLRFLEQVPGPLYVNHEKRVLVACLNSALRCGEINLKFRDGLRKPIEGACEKLTIAIQGMKGLRGVSELVKNATAELKGVLPEIDRQSVFDIPHLTHAQIVNLGCRIMEEKLKLKKEWRDYIKVAVLHHHLVPFSFQMPEYKAFEVAADAAVVLDALAAYGFQVILTGHKHQPYHQKVQFDQSEMLVAGGLTVGGTPVAGYGQGIRYLELEQKKRSLIVRITDLPCDLQGDVRRKVRIKLQHSWAVSLQLAESSRQ